jgi:hypothetical protein
MLLQGLRAIDYTTLSNSALDDAYATAYASGDSRTYTDIGLEIDHRNASVSGFFSNLTGKPFPKYDSIQASKGEFVASEAAPQAVITSAGTLATEAGQAVKTLAGTGMLALLAGGVIAVAYLFRKR